MKNIWLVNDTLTCIPGTKTFWHNLLDWFPNVQDKTFGYTDFYQLPSKIEREVAEFGAPDMIIRNASYFRRINSNIPTVSLLQDVLSDKSMQIDVCNNSSHVICVSKSVADLYRPSINKEIKIIPIGTDFSIFNESLCNPIDFDILPNSILFIGDSTDYPKGFSLLLDIVNKSNYNFCFVMKDEWATDHPRIKVFNKINHSLLPKIINSCSLAICTSKEETLHLAGIECAACNLPLVVSNVGIYKHLNSGEWGIKVVEYGVDSFLTAIKSTFDGLDNFKSRDFFINQKLDLESCKNGWSKLLNE